MGPIESQSDQPFAPSSAGSPLEPPGMYVSTDLSSWVTEEPRLYARDVIVDGTTYRRLDPGYYTWLRERMARAKARFEAGGMTPRVYAELRRRFNGIHALAMCVLGEDVLVEAGRTTDLRGYIAPGVEHWRDALGMEGGAGGNGGMPGEHGLVQREDGAKADPAEQVDLSGSVPIRSLRASQGGPGRPTVQRSIFG